MEARGFTLLELLTALGIFSVLAAMLAWGGSAWLPDFRLDAAARQVVVDLRTTRARAMSERLKRRLLFLPAAEAYRPQRRAGSSYADDGAPIGLPAGIDLVDCTALSDAIGFAAYGTATTFGTVVLRAANGSERRVIVDIVGRVRVEG